MSLPAGVETVTLSSGKPLTLPDGTPIRGRLYFEGPDLVTIGEDGVVLGGTVQADLVDGEFTVTLAATDATGMDPSGWTYRVRAVLTNAPSWVRYVSLPKATPSVVLADVVVPDPVDGEFSTLVELPGVSADDAGMTVQGHIMAAADGSDPYGDLPKGNLVGSNHAALVLGSSFGGEDDGTGTDTTGRIALYSYQRASTFGFGETIRNFLMRQDAKAMTAWYGPQSGTSASYNANRDWAPGSSAKPWCWTGAHYEANDHGSIHGHWEVEVPDESGALQGRLEVPFVDQENSPQTIGVAVTNIRTNLADFSVRASTGVLRVGGSDSFNKDILLSISSDRAASGRRWILRATDETESGGNAGTNFHIRRYDDTGAYIDSPVQISRFTGNVTLGPGLVARRGSATSSSLSLNSSSLGGGVGVLAIGNTETVPSFNPTGGIVMYVSSGRLKIRQPDGTDQFVALTAT